MLLCTYDQLCNQKHHWYYFLLCLLRLVLQRSDNSTDGQLQECAFVILIFVFCRHSYYCSYIYILWLVFRFGRVPPLICSPCAFVFLPPASTVWCAWLFLLSRAWLILLSRAWLFLTLFIGPVARGRRLSFSAKIQLLALWIHRISVARYVHSFRHVANACLLGLLPQERSELKVPHSVIFCRQIKFYSACRTTPAIIVSLLLSVF